ncbi:MAG: hypothetical protein ACLRJV_16150 [Eubacteriales bacterium]
MSRVDIAEAVRRHGDRRRRSGNNPAILLREKGAVALPMVLAHRLTCLGPIPQAGIIPPRPDGKAQVSAEYRSGLCRCRVVVSRHEEELPCRNCAGTSCAM